jgi:hypothetical protein
VRRVTARLSDREWDSLALQLGRYALHKSHRFYWSTGSSGELPNGEMTESLVSKAFYLWLTGRRKWNREKYADLESFLKSVIDSLLSHSATGYDNRRIDETSDQPRILQATPESELLGKERQNDADRLIAEVLEEAREDVVVTEIVNAMRAGIVTRREIVSTTGRSKEVIDNGLKRLRRLAAGVVRSNKTYEDEKVR